MRLIFRCFTELFARDQQSLQFGGVMTCQSTTFQSHICQLFTRVVCIFIGFNDRYHRLLHFDAFTGCLSEFAGFRMNSVIYGAKLHKVRRRLEFGQSQIVFRALGRSKSERSDKEQKVCQMLVRALGWLKKDSSERSDKRPESVQMHFRALGRVQASARSVVWACANQKEIRVYFPNPNPISLILSPAYKYLLLARN